MRVDPPRMLVKVDIVINGLLNNPALLHHCHMVVPLPIHRLRLNQILKVPLRYQLDLRQVRRTTHLIFIFQNLTALRLLYVLTLLNRTTNLQNILQTLHHYMFRQVQVHQLKCIILKHLTELQLRLVFMQIPQRIVLVVLLLTVLNQSPTQLQIYCLLLPLTRHTP